MTTEMIHKFVPETVAAVLLMGRSEIAPMPSLARVKWPNIQTTTIPTVRCRIGCIPLVSGVKTAHLIFTGSYFWLKAYSLIPF